VFSAELHFLIDWFIGLSLFGGGQLREHLLKLVLLGDESFDGLLSSG
jgi:hypothetical protein